MQKNVIQLNTGGYKFKTTTDTLTKISCKLSQIVDLKSTAGNAPIFVDRDTKHFGFILNFLRNGGTLDVWTLPNEKHALASILVESAYYELSNIIRKNSGTMQMSARSDIDFVKKNLKLFDCSAIHYNKIVSLGTKLCKRRGLCYEIYNYHNQNMLLDLD